MSSEVLEIENIYKAIKKDTQALRDGLITEELHKRFMDSHNLRLRARKVKQETEEHVEYGARLADLERRAANQAPPAFGGRRRPV